MKLCQIHRNAAVLHNINRGFPSPIVEVVVDDRDCESCQKERKDK